MLLRSGDLRLFVVVTYDANCGGKEWHVFLTDKAVPVAKATATELMDAVNECFLLVQGDYVPQANEHAAEIFERLDALPRKVNPR